MRLEMGTHPWVGPNLADASQPIPPEQIVKISKVRAYPIAPDPTLARTCSQT